MLIAWEINDQLIDSGMPLVNASLNFLLYEKELASQKDIDALEMRHFSTRLRNGEQWIFQNPDKIVAEVLTDMNPKLAQKWRQKLRGMKSTRVQFIKGRKLKMWE